MIAPLRTVRLLLDLAGVRPALDTRTGGTPVLPRSGAARIELAFAMGGDLVDVSKFESIRFWLSDYFAPRTVPFLKRVVSRAALNSTLTIEEWAAGTAAHAMIDLADGELDLDLRKNERTFHAGFRARTFDRPAKKFTLGHTVFRIVER